MTADSSDRLYRGMTEEERCEERRRRLLDTALELFAGTGYASTSIGTLCRAAKVTERHFYDEFGSREQLLRQLYDEIVETTMADVVSDVMEADPTPRARAHAGLGAFLRSMLADPRRARVAGVEAVGVSPEFEQHRRQTLHAFAELVASQAREMSPRAAADPGRTRRAAIALVGGIGETVVDQALSDDPAPIEQLAQEMSWLYDAAASIEGTEDPTTDR
ncbi:MAG: TetR/AcrR family transcriptional regulator [Microthrixaceae bacterium]